MTNSVDLGAVAADLREKAGKATAGPWTVASDLPALAIAAGQYRVVQTPNQNNYRHFGPANSWDGIGDNANAAYIAAANPSTILALLSERDALLARLGEQGWSVKPLEWSSTTDGDLSRAECILGTYRVWTHYDAAGLWFWEHTCAATRKDTGTAISEAQAKAFVEAHYAAAIRSAILPGGEGWKPIETAAERMPDRWPRKGDRMRFLGRNGYDDELARAKTLFVVGDDYEVVSCEVGGWWHSVRFTGFDGSFNGVMFELLPAPSHHTVGEAE